MCIYEPTREDARYMARALRLAAKAEGRTYPNPMVGAVIVKNGEVVSEAYHRQVGEEHAERAALRRAGEKAKGADLYVTLEPCDHQGRTPPCTEAVIESGIRKVFMAMSDPARHNDGRGASRLRAAGISVSCGLLQAEAKELNRQYLKFVTRGIPYVTIKSAQTVDGKVAASDGSSKWITSHRARRHSYRARARYDAIVVGINTVLRDDPFLLDERRRRTGTARVVVDSSLRLETDSNIVRTAGLSRVFVATTRAGSKNKKKIGKLKAVGVDALVLPDVAGRVCLKNLLRELAFRDMVSILIEGGAVLTGAFLGQSLADEVLVYQAPMIIGGGKSSFGMASPRGIEGAVKLECVSFRRIGVDVMMRYKVRKEGEDCSPDL